MSKPLVMHCDKKTIEALANNPKYHSKIQHIEFDFHFVREHIAQKELTIEHVSSSNQLEDIFTKLLAFDHFAYTRTNLNVHPRP